MDIINICMSNHCSHDSKKRKQKHVARHEVEEQELQKAFLKLKLEYLNDETQGELTATMLLCTGSSEDRKEQDSLESYTGNLKTSEGFEAPQSCQYIS